MEEGYNHEHQKELQLLPMPPPPPPPPQAPPLTTWLPSPSPPDPSTRHHPFKLPRPPSPSHLEPNTTLDLQLSISCVEPPTTRPMPRASTARTKKVMVRKRDHQQQGTATVEALRWQAAEQIRLAAMERAYAERVREMTRREMEMAQSEFARARAVWDRAREEVAKAERLKENAIHVFSRSSKVDHQPSSQTYDNSNISSSNCIEITCYSCRQRFRPN